MRQDLLSLEQSCRPEIDRLVNSLMPKSYTPLNPPKIHNTTKVIVEHA